MPNHQFSINLINHEVAASLIQQRTGDGYINATQLCHAAGKRWHNYIREETTGAFMRALSSKTKIELSLLNQDVQSVDGLKSTWVHPKVAIHLAQWLSADFAVQVSEWVYDWMNGKRQSTEMPYHIRRHMANIASVPTTHFSILQEMTMSLIAPLESYGYSLPEHMVPDISQGRMFCKFARDTLGLDTDSLPTYTHRAEGKSPVQAKLYPIEFLGAFRKFINEVWLPSRAEGYFKERDPSALLALDKVLLQLTYKPNAANQPAITPRNKRAA